MPDYEPNVILLGTPEPLALTERIRYVENADDGLKLLRGNRYEHFAPTTDTELHHDRELRILVWRGCTYVAE